MSRTSRRVALVAAIVTGLSCGVPQAGWAAEAGELTQIRRQLTELAARLDALERENAVLKAQNASLGALPEQVAGQVAKQDAELQKLKGADWAGRISARGDFRYRHEQIADDLNNNAGEGDKRYRDRIRARLGFDARVSDSLSATLMLATAPDDPRSSNQTLTGVNSRKAIGLDLAYLDWKLADAWTLTAGKMRYPVVRPGQSLFLDGDINPEGLAVAFRQGRWFGSAYQLFLEERSTAADTLLYGGQAGTRVPVGDGTLLLALQYSDLVKGQGLRPFYGCSGAAAVSAGTIGCANGNTVLGTNAANAVLASDFNVLGLAAELNLRLGRWPMQVWADYARNLKADAFDTAWTAGLLFGRAADRGTWEAGLAYEVLQKDALFGQLIDSDFADGRTDGEGWVFRGGYALARNWLFNATYFLTERQLDVGIPSDYRRLMLDLSLRF